MATIYDPLYAEPCMTTDDLHAASRLDIWTRARAWIPTLVIFASVVWFGATAAARQVALEQQMAAVARAVETLPNRLSALEIRLGAIETRAEMVDQSVKRFWERDWVRVEKRLDDVEQRLRRLEKR